MYQKPSLERFGTFRDLTQVGASITSADFTFVCAQTNTVSVSTATGVQEQTSFTCGDCTIGIGTLSA